MFRETTRQKSKLKLLSRYLRSAFMRAFIIKINQMEG